MEQEMTARRFSAVSPTAKPATHVVRYCEESTTDGVHRRALPQDSSVPRAVLLHFGTPSEARKEPVFRLRPMVKPSALAYLSASHAPAAPHITACAPSRF